MSSWDRQSAIEKYAALLDSCDDGDALLEELGTPTKLAISLARDYIPSPPPAVPEALAEPTVPEALTEPAAPEALPEAYPVSDAAAPETLPAANAAPADFTPAAEPEPVKSAPPVPPVRPDAAAAPAPAPAAATPKRRVRPGAMLLYVLLSLMIGLPIAAALICVGVPFLATGAGIAALAVKLVLDFVAALHLISDVLLVIGAGLAAAAAGLVVAWFGLWLSLTLGQLWIGKVIFPLGRRLCFKKEAQE